MQISVSLQAPFSYSIYPIIAVAVFLIGICVWLFLIKEKRIEPIEDIEIKKVPQKTLRHMKNKYLKKLEVIEKKVENEKITIRTAYHGLSIIIRYFVYEVTNVKVQNYTLKDIEKLNLPSLTELIQEYYPPEFAEKSLGNIKSSIEKTRKVIEKWN